MAAKPLARLTGKPLEDVLDRVLAIVPGSRRATQQQRWEIYRENYTPIVAKWITGVFTTPEVTRDIIAQIRPSPNVLLDAARKLAVVYKHGVRRVVGVGDGDEEMTMALAMLDRETMQRTKSPESNRRAWALGPLFRYPVVRARRAANMQVLPHQYTVEVDQLTGRPYAVAWAVKTGERFASIDDVTIVVADGISWRYFDAMRRPKAGPEGLHEIQHGILDDKGQPRLPGSFMRVDDPDDDDFWLEHKHSALQAVTVYASATMAIKSWIRRTQNRKIPYAFGQVSKLQKQQALGAEKPFMGELEAPGMIKFGIGDLTQSVDEFHKDVAWEVERVMETYGVPAQAFTYDLTGTGGTGEERLAIQHEALSQVRFEQVEYLERYEQDFALVQAQVLRRSGHPLGDRLDPLAIAESFRIDVPPLTRVDDPAKKESLNDKRRKRLAESEIDQIMFEHPGWSRDDAWTWAIRVMDDRGRIAKELAARNLVLDQERGVLGTPETLGAMGGRPKGSNDDADDENSDDTSST